MHEELGIILLLAIILICVLALRLRSKNDNIFKDNIYLDNNGTTTLCAEAAEWYLKGSKLGNASSSYATDAKSLIEKSDNLIKNWVQSPDYNVIYTSGATESNNTIIKIFNSAHQQNYKPHIILSSYEHRSSLDCAQLLAKDGLIDLTLINPSIRGFINPNDVANAITNSTALVSIMHINNELGTINNIKEICAAAKSRKPDIVFHTDAVQSFGKFSIPMKKWRIDALSASYHKFYGPQGVGLLVVADNVLLKIKEHPLISGSQNYGARGGTTNISGIAGGLAALSHVIENRDEKNKKLFEMKKYIVNKLSETYNVDDFERFYGKPDNFTIAKPPNSSRDNEIIFLGDNPLLPDMAPNTLLMSVIKYGPIEKHFCNLELKKDLQNKGILVSIGSACHSESPEPSHVLHTIKAPYPIRCGVIRISLGDYNTMSDVKKFCDQLINSIQKQNL